VFLNISNHPSAKWSAQHRAAAEILGTSIVDVPFPNVPPSSQTEEVAAMAKNLVAGLASPVAGADDYAMVQGEASMCWELSRRMLSLGWHVCVATTERRVVEGEGGQKTATFEFCQFRLLYCGEWTPQPTTPG